MTITVQCTFLHNGTFLASNNMEKIFTNHDDFIKFYKLTKECGDVVLNVMNYDAHANPILQQKYEMLLLTVSKENPS